MDDLLVATDLLPRPATGVALSEMALADAPDFMTAVAAGEVHGLAPPEALKAAFGKWLSENADAIQTYKLANFYDGKDASRAFVDYTRLAQFLTIIVAEQGRQIHALQDQQRLTP